MAPTLVASYVLKSTVQGTAALVTPSFTPSNGEVIVIKSETWDRTITMGSVTGGSQTYTSRAAVPGTGFRPWCGIHTATIAGSPGSMTISISPSASARYSATIERWSGATLAASPVVGTADGSSTAAQGTLTTSAPNSIVSWVSSDAQSIDPATRAYLNSATDEGVRDDHIGANGVGYHAYYTASSAGSTTFGLSAPTGQFWCTAGIEVLAATSTPTGSGLAVAHPVTAAGGAKAGSGAGRPQAHPTTAAGGAKVGRGAGQAAAHAVVAATGMKVARGSGTAQAHPVTAAAAAPQASGVGRSTARAVVAAAGYKTGRGAGAVPVHPATSASGLQPSGTLLGRIAGPEYQGTGAVEHHDIAIGGGITT